MERRRERVAMLLNGLGRCEQSLSFVLVSLLLNAENQRLRLHAAMPALKTLGSEVAPVDVESVVYVLSKLRFSEPLPEPMLERIAALAELRGFPAHSVLFRENADNDRLMIVAVGRVALDMRVPGRGEVRIMSLGPGDMLAWSALIGKGRMTTSAVALEDTQVVAIRARDVLQLCESDPEFGYHLMRQVAEALANRLVATRLQLLDLFAESEPFIPQGPD